MNKEDRNPRFCRPAAWLGSVLCALFLGLVRCGAEAAFWVAGLLRGERLRGTGPAALFRDGAVRSFRLLRFRLDASLFRPRTILRMALAVNLAAPQLAPALAGGLLAALVSVAPARADIAHRINFQGRLTDPSNNPRSGSFTFKFRIYDAPTGGTALWPAAATEDQVVTVTNGVFSVQLGAVSPIPASVFADANAYLEVQVFDGSVTETLSPRQQLVGSPYAFNAGLLAGNTSDYFVSTAAVNQTVAGIKTFTSHLIVNGGNLGLGTASPSSLLDVFNGSVTVRGTNSGLVVYDGDIRLSTTTPGTKGIYFTDGSYMTSAGLGSANSLSNSVDAVVTGDSDSNGTGGVILRTGSGDRLTVLNGGSVGVGTGSPLSLLHAFSAAGTAGPELIVSTGTTRLLEVNGSSVALGIPLFFPDGTSQATAAGASQWMTSGSDIYNGNAGNVGVGTSVPQAKIHAFSAAGSAEPQLIVSTGTTRLFEVTGSSVTIGASSMTVIQGGFVGIGTVLPSYRLHVLAGGDRAVYGENNANGIGAIYGLNNDTSNGWGVYGSGGKYGVYGSAGPLSSGGAGVYGTSSVSYGVYGNGTTGVYGNGSSYGVDASGSGTGVRGTASGTGVLGVGTTGTGVEGQGANGAGGYFHSSAGLSLQTGAGNVGLGTGAASARVHMFSAAGDTSLQLLVSTGSTQLFQITGSSIALGLPLYFPDGTSLASAPGASQWTTAGADIYDNNAGNVGVGTTGPSSKFDVFNGSITVRGTNAGVSVSGVNIIDNTGRIPAITSTYFASLDGSALTNLSFGPLPGGSSSYIQNRDTLQSGSTFYVSSGTTEGTMTALGGFIGSGAGLTNLNASNLASGTVGDARLSANVALLNSTQTFSGQDSFLNQVQVSSHVLVSGNIGVGTLSPLSILQTFSAAGTGGPELIVSTGATRLLEVNGSSVALGAPLFFPDGTSLASAPGASQWTTAGSDIYDNNAGNVGVGTTGPSSKFDVFNGSITVRGTNAGVSVSGVNIIDNTGRIPAITSTYFGSLDGSALTNLSFGTLPGGSSSYIQNRDTLQSGSTFYVSSGTTEGTMTSLGGFIGSGAGLTNLSASNLASGTVGDARLSANVALLNSTQTFSGQDSFLNQIQVSSHVLVSGNIGVGTLSPAYGLDVWSVLRTTDSAYLATAAGNVGIGTISPSYKLHVVPPAVSGSTAAYITNMPGDQTGTALYLQADYAGVYSIGNVYGGYFSASGGSALVTEAGNVGLGTLAPASRVHGFQPAGTTGSQLLVSTGSAKLFEVSGTSVALGVPLVFPDGTLLTTAGGVGGGQWTASGSDIYNNNFATGNVGVGTNSPTLGMFQVGTGSFTVLATGEVGVGTGVPEARLHTFSDPSAGGNTGVGVQLLVSTGTAGIETHLFEVTGASITLGLPLYFPDGTSMTTAGGGGNWTLTGSDIYNSNPGNVGVGTNAPSSKFDVSDGSVTIRGANLGLAVGASYFYLNTAGNVGLGTATPLAHFHTFAPGGNTGVGIQLLVSTGDTNGRTDLFEVTASSVVSGVDAFKPGGGSWSTLSDIRLKKNIHTLDGALERMLRLRGVNFEWKNPGKDGRLPGVQTGVIAQEVEKVFPEWVGTTPGGIKYVTFRGFEALTIEAMRDLQKENQDLREKNRALEERVKAIEAIIYKEKKP